MSATDRGQLHRRLLRWFDKAKRDLPWRRTQDPYAIWVSEIMLQQTRVDTVIGHYAPFLQRFPTVKALAAAAPEDVLAEWSGLGYYRRARMLHDGAKQVQAQHGGKLPKTQAELSTIKGFGPYTSGAVASIAFGQAAPLVDGNVARVFARHQGLRLPIKSKAAVKACWALANEWMPSHRPGDWNQALMELGATVCTPRAPRCEACPWAKTCVAYAQGTTQELPVVERKAASPLEWRTALIARKGNQVLLGQRPLEARFGGMWEPPMVSGRVSPPKVLATFRASLGLAASKITFRGSFEHVLTHRRLMTDVFEGRATSVPAVTSPDYLKYAWFTEDQLAQKKAVGLSTFARRALALAAKEHA
jgi:A/G-specific adenine glycosylase